MISQTEADKLINEDKYFCENDKLIIAGNKSLKIVRNLKSINSQNEFVLNMDRGKIELSKIKYQTRHKATNAILFRLDTTGPRHQNPDGNFVECPHIHIYKEGYNDKWAYPLDSKAFKNPFDLAQILKDFLEFFNVKDIPQIIIEQSFL